MIQEVAQYIANQTGGVVGEDLFIGARPGGGADACVVILEDDDRRGDADRIAERDLADVTSLGFGVLTRGLTYFTARERAWAVHQCLTGRACAGHRLPVLTEGEAWVAHSFSAPGAPRHLGSDSQGRHEWTAAYVARLGRQTESEVAP